MPLGHDLFYRQFDWMLSRPTGEASFFVCNCYAGGEGGGVGYSQPAVP